MSKIVQAANAMLSNPDKISQVMRGNDEIFFLYDGKYKWSMYKSRQTNNNKFFLHFYPGKETIEQLTKVDEDAWDSINYITYSSEEIGTAEAKNTFSELYSLIQEKIHGVDQVLNDIISDL